MASKLSQIYNGWKNYAWPNEAVEAVAKERAKVCAVCIHAAPGLITALIGDELKDIEGLVCNICDCPLSALARSLDSQCKKNKWLSKVTTK